MQKLLVLENIPVISWSLQNESNRQPAKPHNTTADKTEYGDTVRESMQTKSDAKIEMLQN